MTLEPSLVLLVEPPALTLELFGSKVLLVGALAVVEYVEERVYIYALIQTRVVENGERLLGVMSRSVVLCSWLVMTRLLGVNCIWGANH